MARKNTDVSDDLPADIYPVYTRGERVLDGIVHIVGVLFGVAALSVLLTLSILQKPYLETLALAVYGGAMVLMFLCSAAYHMVPAMDWKAFLRRIDQAAIFMKIAGTYTPFALLKMGGSLGVGLFSTVWVIALLGVGMILAMGQKRRRLLVLLYLALGWLGLAFLWPLMMSMSILAFSLLGIGGALYSIGVIFHIWEGLPFSNAIWHLFVLAATICHYFAVVVAVLIDV